MQHPQAHSALGSGQVQPFPSPGHLPGHTAAPPSPGSEGLLTWGQQHTGAALNTDAIYSFAMQPAKRLGQGDGEVGRLPMEGSLLCVYTSIIPDQAVDDGWTA